MTREAAPLLAEQRKAQILEEITTRGAARVAELVRRFEVSDVTVRRDIAELAAQGLVTKVHGGATASRPSAHEPSFAAKNEMDVRQKIAIAIAAARLVHPGTSLAISAGTTTARLAEALRPVADLTVVTNSLPVSDVLHRGDENGRTVILTGGRRTPSDALVGSIATAALTSLHVDLLFLGVYGFAVDEGLTTPNLMESETLMAMIASARRTVLLADSSKWGVVGLSTIAPLSAVDVLITDDGLSDDALSQLSDHIDDITVASP